MPLEPVARRSLTAEVHEQLSASILAGDFPAGTKLPSERELAATFGVSRPAVREAVQRLAQAGLVTVRQGDGTVALDPRATGTPALLGSLLWARDEIDPGVLADIVELRSLLLPGVVRLAAERATDAEREQIRDRLATFEGAQGPIERLTAMVELWHELALCGGNVALALLSNALRDALLGRRPAVVAELLAAEAGQVEGHRAVTAAVLDGNASRAEATARALLRPGSTAVVAALSARRELAD